MTDEQLVSGIRIQVDTCRSYAALTTVLSPIQDTWRRRRQQVRATCIRCKRVIILQDHGWATCCVPVYRQLSLVLTAPIPTEGWPGRVDPDGWLPVEMVYPPTDCCGSLLTGSDVYSSRDFDDRDQHANTNKYDKAIRGGKWVRSSFAPFSRVIRNWFLAARCCFYHNASIAL